MIEKYCFTREWILQQRSITGQIDPALLEKTILAFELLGRLAKNKLSFVFKGGTCLLLLLKEFKRLSIDVDIVCEQDDQQLIRIFDALIPDSPFSRWNEDPRTLSSIPKKHYKFYFTSQINQRDDYVLLDVLRCGNLFPVLQKMPIDFPLIKTSEKISVTVPSIDSLIGDKMTAFAPRSIGVPLAKTRAMQIIKQLFDLGELFIVATNAEEITASYNNFVRVENSYRNTHYDMHETLQDTLDACFLISQLALRHGISDNVTDIFRKGIRQIGSHMIGAPFGLPQAKIAASRVAFLAAILLSGGKSNFHDFLYDDNRINELYEAHILGDWAILNRLKAFLPECFYYWQLADKFIKK